MRETAPEYITVDYQEYLRIEEASTDVRHELVGGVLHAMVGASRRHNRMIMRLASLLDRAASDGPCEVFVNEVKLRIAWDTVYYPDAMVACDPNDDDPLVVNRPCLVIEVLSPSTSATDRREKLLAYRTLPSLLAYLVIHQDEQRVERHWRETVDAPWQVAFLTDGHVPIPCPETSIALVDVYAGLPSVPSSPAS